MCLPSLCSILQRTLNNFLTIFVAEQWRARPGDKCVRFYRFRFGCTMFMIIILPVSILIAVTTQVTLPVLRKTQKTRKKTTTDRSITLPVPLLTSFAFSVLFVQPSRHCSRIDATAPYLSILTRSTLEDYLFLSALGAGISFSVPAGIDLLWLPSIWKLGSKINAGIVSLIPAGWRKNCDSRILMVDLEMTFIILDGFIGIKTNFYYVPKVVPDIPQGTLSVSCL